MVLGLLTIATAKVIFGPSGCCLSSRTVKLAHWIGSMASAEKLGGTSKGQSVNWRFSDSARTATGVMVGNEVEVGVDFDFPQLVTIVRTIAKQNIFLGRMDFIA